MQQPHGTIYSGLTNLPPKKKLFLKKKRHSLRLGIRTYVDPDTYTQVKSMLKSKLFYLKKKQTKQWQQQSKQTNQQTKTPTMDIRLNFLEALQNSDVNQTSKTLLF